MNSTKLFNFKYMKEVFKESKRLIIFSVLVIPILTILVLYASTILTSIYPITLETLSVINLLLMYVIPFVISNMFFGFMYKKNSTDFRMSMPISRKSLFITSIIGGIILIIGIQLFFSVIMAVCKFLFKSSLIIPWKEIFDCFVMCTISYIFVFMVSSLASTISGNIKGQVIVTLIILFLVPVVCYLFGIMAEYDNDYLYKFNIVYENNTISVLYDEILPNYTMPYRFIRIFSDGNYYSSGSLIRMVVLEIIYFAVGLKLFEKRRMENNDGSYSSLFMHMLVKTLTLIPILQVILLIGTDIDNEITFFYVTVIVVLAIYYFIYDYIVQMKVPIRISIVTFFISVFALIILLSSIRVVNSYLFYKERIDVDDIKSISIADTNGSSSFYYYSYGSFLSSYLSGDNYIEDEELIDLIFSNATSQYGSGDQRIKLNIKLESGKKYEITIGITDEGYEEIANYIINNSDYIDELEKVVFTSGIIVYNKKIVNSRYADEINEELENCIDEIAEFDITNNISSYLNDEYMDYYTDYFYKYVYVNHKLKKIEIPVKISDEMEEIFEDI